MHSAPEEGAAHLSHVAPPPPRRWSPFFAVVALHAASLSVAYMIPIGGAWGGPYGPALHSGVLGSLVLLGCAALSFRDPDMLQTLGLRRTKTAWWVEALIGVGAVFAMYVAMLLLTFAVLALTPMNEIQKAATAKEGAVQSLGQMPLGISLALAAFAGTWEEIAFRGLLFSRTRAAFGVPEGAGLRNGRLIVAILASSLLFALGHGYQGPIGIVQTFVAGLALAILTAWRKSIFAAICAHVTVDAFGFIAIHFVSKMQQHG